MIVGNVSAGAENVLRAAVPNPTFHLQVREGVLYRVGRRELRTSPGHGVFLAPGHEYTAHVRAGNRSLGIQVDPWLLNAELTARRAGRTRSLALVSTEVDLSPGSLGELDNLVRAHRAALEAAANEPRRPGLLASERRLAAWMANRILERSGCQAASPASLQLAEDVESWIRAHIAEPISMERLRRKTGASSRSLQKACLARWGATPLELVTRLRMWQVRERLSGRPPASSVTQVATDCGFTHLGRFAATYKRTFGEYPSETRGGHAAD
jgi:AraC-like DNA-binding protein